MKLSLAHVCILTKDLHKTRDFYCGPLGMKVAFEFKKEGALYGYYLSMGDGDYIEVFEDQEVTPKVSGPFLHLCLETDDIEESMSHLRKKGVETTDIKKGCDNTFQIWFKDPNGLDIELHQYTLQSSQLTGAECEVDW